jgi:dihydrofolate reductase
MRVLRYSINVSLDGCVDHASAAFSPDETIHQHFAESIAQADALVYGRLTYELMQVWRVPVDDVWDEWVEPWMQPFARTIDAARKHVVSSTLENPDWNTEVIDPADLERSVRELKDQPGDRLALGGVTLPLALAELGLIDEYELVVHPGVAGRGPRLLDGLSKPLDLTLVDRTDLAGAATALVYVPAG